ncbi:hypothetical protein [Hyphomicrobium sp.]|uniref:hypothetical protein n=1 Tax=Hyphomicrobium sp. TaxID=82 RepID=UPI002E2ED765|nr:hypothetical protein [Hyphomicrobium sp.]HEX2842107.1 hypothetical protein [Hyphomicrobium sp.]
MKRLTTLCLAIGISIVHPTVATSNEKPAFQLAREFVGHCLQTLADPKRVEAAARALNWKTLDRDMAAVAAPRDKTVPWQSWFVDTAPQPFMIAISKAKFRGQPMATCTVGSTQASVSDFLGELTKVIKLGQPLADYTEVGQRSRVWQIDLYGKPAMVIVNDAEQMDVTGFTIAAMVTP